MAKGSDRSNAPLSPAGVERWQAGAVMVALWVFGVTLFVSVAVALYIVKLVVGAL